MGTHKLKLFQRKLVKLVFNFPDAGLLQLGYCLFGGGLLFGGLSQMGLLSWRNIRRFNESDGLDETPELRNHHKKIEWQHDREARCAVLVPVR